MEHPTSTGRAATINAATTLPMGADRLFLAADDLTFNEPNGVYFARGKCPNGTPFTVAVPFSLFVIEEAHRDTRKGA